MNTEKLYPQLLEFDVWQDYLDLGWYLFPVNPWNKQPYETEIFELPEEEERRLAEMKEEERLGMNEKERDRRKKARKEAQKYGHGFKDATKTMGTFEEVGTLAWLVKCVIQKGGYEYKGEKRPSYPQIGCACGPSNLFVIDLDVKADFQGHFSEAPSFSALDKLEEQYGELSSTFTVKTPRNGQHRYFRGHGRSTASVLGKDIDTRSDGGYIILPPSICSVKDTMKGHIRYGQYETVQGLSIEQIGIADLPEWVLERMAKKRTDTSFSVPSMPTAMGSGHNDLEPWETYRNQEWPMEYFHPEEENMGVGNAHNPLTKLAGKISYKVFTPERIQALLYEIWQTYCPEHDQNDVDRIISDAIGWAEGRREQTKQQYAQSLSRSNQYPLPQPQGISESETLEQDEEVYDGYERGIVDTLFSLVGEKLETIRRRNYMATDVGNVEQFVDVLGSYVRYVPGVGFYVWNTSQWEQNDGRVHLLAERFAKWVTTTAKELAGPPYDTKHKKKTNTIIQNDRTLKALVDRLKHQYPIETTIDRFDRDEYLLNFTNGTLDLRNGDFSTHREEDYITKMMPFPYDKEAICPSWERFIAKVSGGNPEMERYLQRIAGYALTGSIGAQVFFFLYGPPSTGKSTYLNTLLRLMGCYGLFTDVQTFTGGKDSDKELAKMPGIRYLFAGEPTKGQHLHEGLLKSFTGGDPVVGKAMYQSPFTFRPQCKLFFASNHKPKVDGADGGMFRRVKVVPFRTKIEERDYEAMFKPELPGILNWCIRGCQDWVDDGAGKVGLHEPLCVQYAISEYQDDMDTLAPFIEEYLEEDPEGWIGSEEIFKLYKDWCFKAGIPQSYKTVTGLVGAIKDRGFTGEKKRTTDGQRRGIRGLIAKERKPEIFSIDANGIYYNE